MEKLASSAPVDKFYLTVDSQNALNLEEVPDTFNGFVKNIKLGIAFGRAYATPRVMPILKQAKMTVFFDSSFLAGQRQMSGAIHSYAEDEYDYLSVSAAAAEGSLVTAGMTHVKPKMVVDILPNQPPVLLREYLNRLQRANDELPDERQLNRLMCDVQDLDVVRKRFPQATIMATGIKIAGVEMEDSNRRFTASEAIGKGADLVAAGTAITCSRIAMVEAVQIVLNDIEAAT